MKGPNFIIQFANQQGQTGIFLFGSKKSTSKKQWNAVFTRLVCSPL